MHIQLKTGALFAFAGLWAPGRRDGLPSATILTCGPNELMAPIHNRMPVMLKPADERTWLAPASDPNVDPLTTLLRPYSADAMVAYAVSSLVNSFQNDGPELLLPAKPAQNGQLSLF
jgi:putative SOS response-associated peptidase YedK